MLKSMIIAFAMYSKIPMPAVEWQEKSMKYALCFFPLVGMVVGIIMYMAGLLLLRLNCSVLLQAAVMTVLPVFITGGIHLDGFLDTMDALSSWGDRDKRLAIMKDSRSGAFAVIGGLVYFALSLGVWSELSSQMLGVTALSYMLTRALSGLAIVSFPLAKNTGLACAFSNAAHKKRVRVVLTVWILFAASFMLLLNFWLALGVLTAAAVLFGYHYYICLKYFGGITGDLAGYFLQVLELIIPFACVIICKL